MLPARLEVENVRRWHLQGEIQGQSTDSDVKGRRQAKVNRVVGIAIKAMTSEH